MNSSPMESEQVEDQEEAVRPRSHRCSLCEREYKSKEALSRHRNTHSQKNTYVCHICQAVFYRKDLLARHDRIHGSPTESGSAPRARLRSAVACVSCRQQKIKCIGASPCSACLRSGTSCIRRGIRQKERANLPLILGNEAQESGVFGSPGDEDALPQAWEAQPNLAGLSSSPNAMPAKVGLHEPLSEQGVSQFTFQPGTQDPFNDFIASADEITSLEHLLVADATSVREDWSWIYGDMFLNPPPHTTFNDPQSSASRLPVLPVQVSGEFHGSLSTYADFNLAPQGSELQDSNAPQFPSTSQIERIPQSTTTPHEFTPMSTNSTENNLQRDVIESHIEYAVANVNSPSASETRSNRVWARREGARKVQNAFGLESVRSLSHDSRNDLDRFVSLFFENFHPLCRIFWEQGFDSYQVSPIIFLIIVSIGARFAGEKAAQYGVMLHSRLRALFFASLQVQPTSDEQHVSLTFGMLITAAEIYLGTDNNFFQAQQLIAILVTQSRRSGLFKAKRSSQNNISDESNGDSDFILAAWIDAESKKRIAFEIFRLESYLSSIANIKPLLSAKELHIELPCSSYLWNMSGHDWKRRTIEAIEQLSTHRRRPFSDLVELFIDGCEIGQQLNVEDLERLLLAVQEKLWCFCENQGLWSHLEEEFPPSTLSGEESGDIFHMPVRTFTTLRSNFDQSISALKKWEKTSSQCLQLSNSRSEHEIYVRGQIEFHTTFIRLNTPLDTLSQIASGSRDPQDLLDIHTWRQSFRARTAMEHSQKLWSVVKQNSESIVGIPTRFDLVYLIALHHAALVVWAWTGAGEQYLDETDVYPTPMFDGRCLVKENSRQIVEGFKKLIGDMSPSWFGPTLFVTVIDTIIATEFPAFQES